MEAVKIEGAPKVEVQGVPGAYNTTAQQPQVAPTPNQESQNGLDEFLTFDNTKPNGVKQEPVDEMGKFQEIIDIYIYDRKHARLTT